MLGQSLIMFLIDLIEYRLRSVVFYSVGGPRIFTVLCYRRIFNRKKPSGAVVEKNT